MDDIDENTFMDISKIEVPSTSTTEITTTDSNKSSTDSAMVLSDTTREGSSDSAEARDSSDCSNIPRSFSSILDGINSTVINGDNSNQNKDKLSVKSSKDGGPGGALEREISCDSVLGESKTKLHKDKPTQDMSYTQTNKSDELVNADNRESTKRAVKKVGDDSTADLVNSVEHQCQNVPENAGKPDIILPQPCLMEKHEQTLKMRQSSPDKEKAPKVCKSNPKSSTQKPAQSGVSTSTQVEKGDLPPKSKLKADKPDLLGECIKIETSMSDKEKNNNIQLRISEEKGECTKNVQSTVSTLKSESRETSKCQDKVSEKTCDKQVDCSDGKDAKLVVQESCGNENCTACLERSAGRFVLPPPPRDRRVSSRPLMPPIAENSPALVRKKPERDESHSDDDDVFDSSTASSTFKASSDGQSRGGSTSSGAMAGTSSSASSGDENSSPQPAAKSGKSAHSQSSKNHPDSQEKPLNAEESKENQEVKSLLDAMHKRYYPTMYHKKERTKSDETLASSGSSFDCVSANSSVIISSSLDRNGKVPQHSITAKLPSCKVTVTEKAPKQCPHSRITALETLTDSAIQAKIDAMLTHPSQRKIIEPSRPEDFIWHTDEKPENPKAKPKSKSEGSNLSSTLSVFKSLSIPGLGSPRPKPKSYTKEKSPQRNPLASLSPTFRRKKSPVMQQTSEDEEEENEGQEDGPCQACVFIQVCYSTFSQFEKKNRFLNFEIVYSSKDLAATDEWSAV